MKRIVFISLMLVMLLLQGCSTQSKTDSAAKPDEFIDIDEMDAVEIDTGYGYKRVEIDEFETFKGKNLKIRTNDNIVFIPNEDTDKIIEKCQGQENMNIYLSDNTGDSEYIYEDYLISMFCDISSEEEYLDEDGETYYRNIEYSYDNATMKLKMPVEITDADKLSVYAYSIPDTGRRDKDFYYDRSDNTVTVNFTSEDKTIAVFYDEPPYNGVYLDEADESGTRVPVIIGIAAGCVIIAMISVFVIKRRRRNEK